LAMVKEKLNAPAGTGEHPSERAAGIILEMLRGAPD
jgi:hypothetical protein